MGLESKNFFFCSEEKIECEITSNKYITYDEGRKYVYKNNNDFWIDLEFYDSYSLSLRITLCNPRDSVLKALFDLLLFLFSFKGGKLIDMYTKQVYTIYNEEVKEALKKSYLNREMIFREMYGDYTEAISSEDFYKKQGEIGV